MPVDQHHEQDGDEYHLSHEQRVSLWRVVDLRIQFSTYGSLDINRIISRHLSILSSDLLQPMGHSNRLRCHLSLFPSNFSLLGISFARSSLQGVVVWLMGGSGDNFSMSPLKASSPTVTVIDYSFAMFEVVEELTLIDSTIFPLVGTKTAFFVMLIVSFISVAGWVLIVGYPYSIALPCPFNEISRILRMIGPCVSSYMYKCIPFPWNLPLRYPPEYISPFLNT